MERGRSKVPGAQWVILNEDIFHNCRTVQTLVQIRMICKYTLHANTHYKLLEEKLANRASRICVTLEPFSSKDLGTLESCSMRFGKHCLLNCFYEGFCFVLSVALFLPSKLFVSHLLWLQGFSTYEGDGGEIETLLQKSTGHDFYDITKLLGWPKTSFRFSIRSYRTIWTNLLANSIPIGHSSPCQILGLLLSVTQSCLTLCEPMDCSTPGFLALHYLLEFPQTHIHWINDVIQSSHPLLPSSPSALKLGETKSRFYKLDPERFGSRFAYRSHQTQLDTGEKRIKKRKVSCAHVHYPLKHCHLNEGSKI